MFLSWRREGLAGRRRGKQDLSFLLQLPDWLSFMLDRWFLAFWISYWRGVPETNGHGFLFFVGCYRTSTIWLCVWERQGFSTERRRCNCDHDRIMIGVDVEYWCSYTAYIDLGSRTRDWITVPWCLESFRLGWTKKRQCESHRSARPSPSLNRTRISSI